MSISGHEAANDRLIIDGLAGNDVIDASALASGQIALAINGGAGKDRITGSGGNDLINGGADDDTFVFRPGGGADTILGFVAGANTEDRIDLKQFAAIQDFTAVLALATQVGADTVLNFGAGNTVTLQNVSRTSLDADDFIFKAPEVSRTIPAFKGNGFTRPELHLDATGHIILEGEAADFAGAFGTKLLYIGVPASTPFPPVFDLHV